MEKKCPQCGFYMLSSNCPKCGYESEHIYTTKFKTEPNDLELFLKDEYQKIIHNRTKPSIILLGPLYFSYYNFLIPSIILSAIELYIHYIMSKNLFTGGTLSLILLILLLIIDLIFLRLIYLSFYNTLLLFLAKKRLTKIKKSPNSKELIYKYEPKSILKPILLLILIIFIFIIITN